MFFILCLCSLITWFGIALSFMKVICNEAIHGLLSHSPILAIKNEETIDRKATI